MENREIKILAIDDNMDNLISLRVLIKEAFPNITVLIAQSGQKGLELAAIQNPDVILLDIVMPEMDGFSVCRMLKEDKRMSEIPVVFVTAIKGDSLSRIHALDSGAEAFLSKPIDESELTAQIRAMLKIRTANLQKHNEQERLAALVEEKTYELNKAHLMTINLLEDLKKENEERKESQKTLAKSEEKYRRIAENMSDVVWTADLNLKITYVSPSVKGLFGESVEEYLKHSFEEKFTPDAKKEILAAFLHEFEIEKDPNSDKNRTRILEVLHYRKDGTTIWISMHVSFIRNNKGNAIGILGVTRDINERKQMEEKIRISEEKYRLIAENISDVISVINITKRKATYVSPSIINLIGYTAREAMHLGLEEALTPKSLVFVKETIAKNAKAFMLAPKEPHNYITEVQMICKNGDIIWAELSSKYRYNADREVEILIVSRNIDSRKKQEESIKYIYFHDDLTGLYSRRFVYENLSAIDCWNKLPLSIIVGDINGLKLTNEAFGRNVGDEVIKKIANIVKKGCRRTDIVAKWGGDEFIILLPKSNGERAKQIINEIQLECEKETEPKLSISFGYATKSHRQEDFEEILNKAEGIMLMHKTYESESFRGQTINMILKTLHAKNKREEEHSRRVSEICVSIGKAMNYSESEINKLRMIGLVHDIGKIGIDENILNKDGKLTKEEWTEIKKHCEIGYRILSETNETSELAQYALTHHERLDGKGYPNGIDGDSVSVLTRILSIADSYDAMTAERTYKQSITKEEATQELYKNAGTQFDADIVEVFVNQVLKDNGNFS